MGDGITHYMLEPLISNQECLGPLDFCLMQRFPSSNTRMLLPRIIMEVLIREVVYKPTTNLLIEDNSVLEIVLNYMQGPVQTNTSCLLLMKLARTSCS